MKLAIVKYNAGNIRSVLIALERIGIAAEVTDDPATLRQADKVIFPGVGEASSAMRYLRERELDNVIRELQQPVLGICLGMQLLCTYSEENDTHCLDVFRGLTVKKFNGTGDGLKVPQVGWNDIHHLRTGLFEGIPENSFAYFVHGYYVPLCPFTIAQADYPHSYSAALQKDNFYGVQFHPEKSAAIGERILKNFLAI